MRRLLLAVVATASVVIAALALASSVAFAHSRPVRFDPGPSAVLQSAPAKVTGYFTNPLRKDPNWNFITVKDGQGNLVSTGDLELSSDRKMMATNLKTGLAPGIYTVTWRTWDDGDGEIFGDCFNFFVGQPAADQAVSSNARLDGGGSCQRIEVSAKDGTPVPGVTPTVAAGGEDDSGASTASSSDNGNDIPLWGLIVGIVGGLAVGMVGARVVGRK